MEGANEPSPGDGSSPLRQQMRQRNSLFGDELLNFDPSELEDDNWRDVFDEPSSDHGPQHQTTTVPRGGTGATVTIDSKTDDTANPLIAQTSSDDAAPGSDSNGRKGQQDGNDFDPRYTAPVDTTKRTPLSSSGDKNDENDSSASGSEAWQNAATDQPHRKKMREEITQLLFARKKEKTSDEKWVARIKAQAGVFESQLYKNADSLEAYMDRTTLKPRIAKLANAFASHFKQAKRNSMRSSVSSMSTLGSLDANFANVDLRRTSMGSMASAGKGPMSTGNLRGSQSTVSAPSAPASGLPINNLPMPQAEPLRRASSAAPNMPSAMMGANNMSHVIGNNMGGMMGPMGMQQQQSQPQQSQNTQQLHQHLLAMQQQRALAQQMNMGGPGGNNPMMATAMMGNNNMAMLNQIQQQQQQQQQQRQADPMNMNLNMMQQHQNLMQQRQQNAMGLGMMQNTNSTLMMGNSGVNMMNMNMPNGLPQVGGMGNMNFGNNSMMAAGDGNSMLPPGMMNGSRMQQKPSGSNDDVGPLSPGTFHW